MTRPRQAEEEQRTALAKVPSSVGSLQRTHSQLKCLPCQGVGCRVCTSLWQYPHLEQSYPADGGGVEGPGVGVVDGLPRLDHSPRHDRDHMVVREG